MKTINKVLFTAIVGIWIVLSDPIARSQSVSQPQSPHSTKEEEKPPKEGTPGVGDTTPGVKEDEDSPKEDDRIPGAIDAVPGTTPGAQEDPPKEGTPGTIPGIRGRGGFCLIAPSTLGQTSTIWNDLPLFIWDGSVSNIEIRLANSDTVLWTAEPDSTALSVQYDGDPLEPGQTYDVVMTTTGQLIFTFTVMDAQTGDEITADLQTLEEQALEQGADDRSIAFARAQYFANRGLRWDALQEAFSAIEPGEDTIAIAALLTCDLQNE